MAITIQGGGGNAVNASTAYALNVNPTSDYTNAGFVTAQGEVTSGITGSPRLVRPHDISPDYRLRTGTDSLFWNDTFAQTSLNLSKYLATESTHTKAISAGYLVFNSGSSVAAGSSVVKTWRTFPILGSMPTYFEAWLQFSQDPQTNCVCEFGLGIASAATAPTDGAMFRLDGAGVMQGIVNYGGSETQATLTGFTPASNTVYHFLMVMAYDRTEFWVDDVMYAYIPTPTTAASPCLSNSLPLLLRQYHTGATALAQQMRVSQVTVCLGDATTNRLWATAMAGMGNSGIHKPDGAVSAQSANFVASTQPATVTVTASSNPAATYLSLGGQFAYNVMNANEIDYILFEYQVPAASTVQPGRNYVLRGVRVDTALLSTVCTTNTLIQYGMCVGNSAESLATADSSSAGTRAPRRFTLGMQSFTTAQAIGTMANPPYIDVNMDAPIIVEPGAYIDLLVKFAAATTANAPIFRGTAFYNGYWE